MIEEERNFGPWTKNKPQKASRASISTRQSGVCLLLVPISPFHKYNRIINQFLYVETMSGVARTRSSSGGTTFTNASGTEIRNSDMLAVRSYITAQDETQYAHVHQSTVILDLTHSNLIQRHIEIRFDLHDTLGTLRQRIHQKTGTSPGFQRLQVTSGGELLAEIPPEQDDGYKLGYYGLQHGMQVHCVDLNPHSGSKGGQYEDVSLVEKYRMSDQEYNQRKGTLRDWGREQKEKDSTFTLAKHAREHREMVDAVRQHKLGLPLPQNFHIDATGQVARCDDDVEPRGEASKSSVLDDGSANAEYGIESVAGMTLGQRCEVEPGARRGVISFVGEILELDGAGYWVGVTFDEPVGKTDGTVMAGGGGVHRKRYFEAMPNYGGFVRGKNVQVGDFPERDLFDESDDEDEL
jgi:tubulin-specific chaperone B